MSRRRNCERKEASAICIPPNPLSSLNFVFLLTFRVILQHLLCFNVPHLSRKRICVLLVQRQGCLASSSQLTTLKLEDVPIVMGFPVLYVDCKSPRSHWVVVLLLSRFIGFFSKRLCKGNMEDE